MLERDSEYLKDESRQQGMAEDILFVKDMQEAEAALAGPGESSLLTVQGSRTGISGAAVPVGGKIINFSRLSGVIGQGEDEKGAYLDVYPGTTLEEIQKNLPKGLFFPAEPTEETATIGGMFSVNAAGPSAGYYGTVGDNILGAEVYFPEFGFLEVSRGRYVFDKNGTLTIGKKALKTPVGREKRTVRQLTPMPGMDLLDLLAGSEGMLGIFGRLRLRLLKRPKEKWRFLFFFQEEHEALGFAEEICKKSSQWNEVHLTAADFMNKKSMEIFQRYAKSVAAYAQIPQVPGEMCGVMLEIISEQPELVEQALEELANVFEEHGGSDECSWAGDSPDEYMKIQRLRHAVPECINMALHMPDMPSMMKLSADVYVGSRRVQDYLKEVYEITGGCAVTIHLLRKIYHIDPLFEDEETYGRALLQRERLWQSAVDSGGLLAAENGIGKGKPQRFGTFIPDGQKQVMDHVKRFFDPGKILNPGNMSFIGSGKNFCCSQLKGE